ncbi:ribosome biogenesis protein WDR12 homolog isoform X2 [Tripterygium wilfordii]|uniref:ribosome biogenesis protein WDR12 homolog isoform X2 n=1 Tax=Tripterygium wilfordii TaxID=458696 RepID=UPI0018F84BE5|nr:ribosome biogenesis protein WDR12 homolog isoform X2 [Tripterygium wilfordii]
MDMGGEIEEEEMSSRRIQVRFVTKLKDPYKVPNASISIPTNLTRYGLSIVVNNLLQSGNSDWQSEPFDFLIDGELVRMSLEKFLSAKGISLEKILEIEYVQAVAPRKEEEPSFHDDWVSAVDGSSSRFILTGSYDCLGRVWKSAGLCGHVLEGHSNAVTAVSITTPEDVEAVTVATASKDRSLRLWKFNTGDPQDYPMKMHAFKILRDHRASVQSVAANASGNMVCSGSWDCTINLWSTDESNTEGAQVSIKKRKVKDQVEESQSEGEAVETGKDITNMFCGKALNCLDAGGEGSALIAAGASDPILRIWDPRKPGTSAPVFQFSSHTSWISACKWHVRSWFHLLSASYDGKVMLWDLRTAWPLAIMDSHKDKVLCADWWKGDSIISGGADSNLRISSNIPVQ